MAKDKVGKVAGKKDEPKKSKKAPKPAKESGLSAERVVESDSEKEAKAAKLPAKKEMSGEKKAPKKKMKAATPPPPPPPKEPASSESSDKEESDSDEDMPDADAPVMPKKPETVPAKINGVKRKAEEQQPEAKRVKVSAAKDESSDDSSDDDDEEETDSEESSGDKADATNTQRKAQQAAKGDADSDGSSEDTSDEEESDSEEETKASKTQTSQPKASTTQAATMSHTKAIPVKPYKPPHAYSAASVTSSALSASNLAGKQVWVITAPSSVPLKEIKEVSLAAVQSGAPILEHNGISYKLGEDSSRTMEFDSAVLPSSKSYDPAKQRIVKKLVLQRKIDLPNLTAKQADITTGSRAAADVAMPSISTARPQPKGMRMRYKPPGFGAGDPGLGSDPEDESARSAKKDKSLQFSKALGGHGAAEKPDVENPKKKSKKKHKSEDVEMVNGSSELKLSKTISKDSVDSKDGLSKEEKRKRKEEKRARKEAKAKAAGEK